jgi:flagellar hook-associated protein 2
MRVNGLSAGGGSIPGRGLSEVDSMIDKITAPDSVSIDSSKQRRESALAKKNEFKNLGSLLDKLQSTADQMKMPSGFRKLAVDSSFPDVLSGEISGLAEPGSYEIEVAGLARTEKQLAFGFADKDKTPVGFGYMRVAVGEEMKELTIEPGATLQDVASKINDSLEGVRASVINTGSKEDPFRLMVTSKTSGVESFIEIDPDTTFTEFKRQVAGQDLQVKFEGVDVKRSTNALNDLIEGVHLKAVKAAPGTAVTVNVRHDIDKTSEGVREFVKQFNEVQAFGRKQSQVDSSTGTAGQLSGESSLRQVNRSLQNSMASVSLGTVGISTNPKTGELNLDESKLKESLSRDYEGVVRTFASTDNGPGLAARMSDAIKALQDRTNGAVASRVKGIEQRIKSQDQEIARKEERMVQRRSQLERTFSSLDAKMSTMQANGQVLAGRFGAQESSSGS